MSQENIPSDENMTVNSNYNPLTVGDIIQVLQQFSANALFVTNRFDEQLFIYRGNQNGEVVAISFDKNFLKFEIDPEVIIISQKQVSLKPYVCSTFNDDEFRGEDLADRVVAMVSEMPNNAD